MGFLFYQADSKYCDFLKEVDSRVPCINNDKSSRPFIGIVLSIHGYNYFAPLTSPKPKHLTMRNQIDFIKINGGIWGAINLNNMIPIHKSCLRVIDLNIVSSDDLNTIAYKNLLNNQLSWCNNPDNVTLITKRADRLYKMVVNNKINNDLFNRCCSFRKLEKQYINYCKMHNLCIEISTT